MNTFNFKPSILPHAKRVPRVGIICSSLERVERFAHQLLQHPTILTQYRGYKVYAGIYNGEDVFLAYVGIGAPSAAILIEELIAMGAQKLIRVGTNDNPTENINERPTFVIEEAIGTKSLSGQSSEKPDAELVESLSVMARRLNIDLRKSKSLHIDFYYHFLSPEAFAETPQRVRDDIAEAGLKGAPVRDMESACLFYLGKLRGVKTASLLHTILRHSVAREYENEADLAAENNCGRLALEVLTQKGML